MAVTRKAIWLALHGSKLALFLRVCSDNWQFHAPWKRTMLKPEDIQSQTKRIARICFAVSMAVAMVSGCTAVPTAYANTLSKQDPKWQSPQCAQIRAEAAKFKQRDVKWASGLLLGPYSLALVAAGKEHQEKQRILFAREVHLRCSSLPLPKELQVNPSTTRKSVSERG